MARRFKLLSDGRVLVRMLEEERDLLTRLPGELTLVVDRGQQGDGGTGPEREPESSAEADPVRARLFPRAYLDPTEEEAESEFQRLVHDDLVRERLAALSLVSESLERAVVNRSGLVEVDLTPDEVQAWLGVLNDARLTLGIVLGVTEDTDYDGLDPDDPDTAPYAVYGWLTMLQGALLDALMR